MDNKKILIIEDEKGLNDAMEFELKKAGFVTTKAFTGIDALNAIEKEDFDLVLLDILLPNLNGWDLLERLMEKKIKTIIVSNLSQEADVQRGLNMGAKAFMVKSDHSLEDIVAKVTEVIAEKPEPKEDTTQLDDEMAA